MILVVTGLLKEAAIVAGAGVRTVSGGGRSGLLRERLHAALAPGDIDRVLSFGLTGALQHGFAVGDLAVAATVRGPADRRWLPDPAWTARLAALTRARPADVAGVDAVAATPQAKASLRLRTGAALVDMESHLAASAADERGLPFAMLRAVSDLADDALPPAVGAGMRADGGIDGAAVALQLLRDLRQLPPLLRMARDSGRAFSALKRAQAAAGPDLGAPAAAAKR